LSVFHLSFCSGKYGSLVAEGKVDFLKHYVQHYNCIELNATHYKIYGERGIAKWANEANGKDFLFCPKMYKGVTHFGRLADKPFFVSEFLRGVVAFKQHL